MFQYIPLFYDSCMSAFKGIVGLMAGTAAARETTRLLHSARMALIATIALLSTLVLCVLIISTYFLIQIVQNLS